MATRIVCRAIDCIFNESKNCISEEIVYDPEEGCLTYEVLDELVEVEEDEEEWEDEELFEEDEELDWEDDEDLFDEDFEEDDI
jgi:chaperone required for assembly of F1-ATPase